MKRAFAMFGLLGLVGCFLPIVAHLSLFDARHADPLRVYLVLAAFAVPMVLGFADRLTAAAGLAAIGCFGYLVYWIGFDVLDLVRHGGFGGRAIAIGAFGGLVTSLGAITAKR